MDTPDTDAVQFVQELKKILESKTVRSVLGGVVSFDMVERALAVYAGARQPEGLKERAYSTALSSVLSRAAARFDVDEETLKNTLSDVAYRRGTANVLASIGQFGITMPQRLIAPFLVVWNFTTRCNLRCKHCYAAGRTGGLSLEERLNVVDQLADAGVVALAISGGEPLMDDDVWEVASHAVERGLMVSIATNGTLIDEDVARRLKQAGVAYVEISLDSHLPEVHDAFRGMRGAYERTMKGIRSCVDEGLMVGIATTATRLNLDGIPDMVKLARDSGAERLIVFNLVPTGRAKQEVSSLELSTEERWRLLGYLYDELQAGGLGVFSTSPMYAVVSLQRMETGGGHELVPTHFADVKVSMESFEHAEVLAEFIGGCGAGRIYCSVEANGDITPCVFLPIAVGHVRDGFQKVWLESELLNALRDRDGEHYACAECEHRYICGGCRARAYAYTNDPLAADPGCYVREVVGLGDSAHKPSSTISR